MTRPVVHPFAERLWQQLFPVQPDDEARGWPLLTFCQAVTLPLHVHDDITRDRPLEGPGGTTMPGWAVLMSPDLCPVEFLPYLAQFKGVRLLPSMTEAQMRIRIRETDGFDRGKPEAIKGAARQFLTSANPGQPARVLLRERYHPDFPSEDRPDDITVITYANETPDLVPTAYGGEPRSLIPNPVGRAGVVGATGWAALAGTISQIPGGGVHFVSTSSTLAGPYYASSGVASPLRDISVTVGQPYSVSIRIGAMTPGTIVRPQVLFRNSAGANVASGAVNFADFTSPGTKSLLSVVAPATAVTMAVTFYRVAGGSAAVGDVVDLTGFAARRGNVAPGIIDGSTPGYVWSGTPDASTTLGPVRWTSPKIERALREQKPIGDLLHYYVIGGQDYTAAINSGRTYAQSKVLYPTYRDRTNSQES